MNLVSHIVTINFMSAMMDDRTQLTLVSSIKHVHRDILFYLVYLLFEIPVENFL